MTSEQKTTAVKVLCDSIVESVAASGNQGAPGGHLYAALMTYGISMEQFESIMGTLVRIGQLRKQGELYFAVKR